MGLAGKNILITGNFGFIGRNLSEYLILEGCNVVGIDNLAHGYLDRDLERDLGDFLRLDVCDSATFARLGRLDLDVIYHLASPSSNLLFEKDPNRAFNETVSGFLNVMAFSKENGIKVIYPSSGSVYGNCIAPKSENATLNPVNLYGTAKAECENISGDYPDVEVTFLRIFAGYGPHEGHKGAYASPIGLFLTNIVRGNQPVVYGNGRQSRDFVYIGNIVEALVNCIPLNGRHTINIGSGAAHSFNSVIAIINEMLGKRVEAKYVSKPRNYLDRSHADITLMRDLLHVEPLALRDGLANYIRLVKAEIS